ncbi:MAG: hypothetical protein ACPIOQ_36970 [Promethearchaeia archaeon]
MPVEVDPAAIPVLDYLSCFSLQPTVLARWPGSPTHKRMPKQKTEDGSEHIDNIGTVLTPLWLLLDLVTDPLSKQPRSLEDRGCAREKPGAVDGLPCSKQSGENIHSPDRAPVDPAANTAEATVKATGVDGLWSGLQSTLSGGFEAVSTGNFARHENRGPSGITGN